MFMQGGDAIRAYRQQVEDFGLAVSAVDAIKVEQANDAFARTGLVFDAVSQQLAIQVAPILSGISEMFIQNAKDAGGVGEATADAFNMVLEGGAAAVNSVAKIDRQFLRTAAALDIFALEVRNGFLEIAREIVEIPTGAVNELIGMLNLVGADIQPLGLSDIGRGVQSLIDGTKAEIAIINEELAAQLNKPLPGDQFKRFVFEAQQAAEESAQAMAAIQSGINDSAGGSPWAILKTLQKRWKSGGSPYSHPWKLKNRPSSVPLVSVTKKSLSSGRHKPSPKWRQITLAFRTNGLCMMPSTPCDRKTRTDSSRR